MRVIVIVPTFNPGRNWNKWLVAYSSQEANIVKLLIVDSSSTDGFLTAPSCGNTDVIVIKKGEFNHGGTRHQAVKLVEAEADVVVFLTQDAILASPNSIKQLLSAFVDPNVSAAYGRQLPHPGAHPIEAHARIYNYSNRSSTKVLADKASLGLKSIFISNSFAAYRVEDYLLSGGFSTNALFGEDTILASKLLLAGKKIRYEARACVYHSHNYSYLQEFKRYFDVGAMHSMESSLLEIFGEATGEGMRFVKSEFAYIFRNAWFLVPSAAIRSLCKIVGYRLGRCESVLPLLAKRALSMHPGFWNNDFSHHE